MYTDSLYYVCEDWKILDACKKNCLPNRLKINK